MQENLKDYSLISERETHCRRYLLLLAKTCNVSSIKTLSFVVKFLNFDTCIGDSSSLPKKSLARSSVARVAVYVAEVILYI